MEIFGTIWNDGHASPFIDNKRKVTSSVTTNLVPFTWPDTTCRFNLCGGKNTGLRLLPLILLLYYYIYGIEIKNL